MKRKGTSQYKEFLENGTVLSNWLSILMKFGSLLKIIVTCGFMSINFKFRKKIILLRTRDVC